MTKRSSLAANVKAAATVEPPVAAAPAMAKASAPEPPSGGARRAASREGLKAVYAWVEPAEHKRLKQLSLDTDSSIDSLVREAIHMLLAKRA